MSASSRRTRACVGSTCTPCRSRTSSAVVPVLATWAPSACRQELEQRRASTPRLQRAAPGLRQLETLQLRQQAAPYCWGRHRSRRGEETVAGSAEGDLAAKKGGHDGSGTNGDGEHLHGCHKQPSRRCGRMDHGHGHGQQCGGDEAQGARKHCGAVHGGLSDGSGHDGLHQRDGERRTIHEQRVKVNQY